MKPKTFKRKLCAIGTLVFLSLIVYSCWQDEWSSSGPEEVIFDSNKELTIAEAKKWYNTNNPSASRSLSADGMIPAKPDWNKAKESRKGDFEVVETTLMTSGSTVFMDNETKEKYGLQDDLNRIYNVARMVVLKNLKTGDTYNFIMIFIGTYDYLMHTTSFKNNSYLHREPDFDGKVLFYNFNYGLVNGWKYEAGKIVATVSPGTEEGYRMSLERGRGQSVCNVEVDWTEKRNCHNDIVWDHELGMPGLDVICEIYLHPEYHEVCLPSDDDDPMGGGGGGGYNPPSNPPEVPPTPCKRAKTLSQDAAFKSRIKDVYRKTFSAGNKVEQGFIQTSNGQTIFPSVQESGSAKFTNEQIAGKEIMEWYHSHPTGSMITSWADLKALAIRYQQGYIKSENFTYGVVSEFGCLSIMISSPTDFNAFATKIRNDELLNDWNDEVVGAGGGGVERCIGLLLLFLQDTNSGLSIMFSSNIDESNPTWNAQEVGSNGNSVNMECNQ